MVKIATIGGGSSYTPELIEGFIKRYNDLPIKELWLVDIEEGKEKLEIIGAMAQRMWDASPYEVKVHTTLDRKEALINADYVTTQFRVGFLEARIKDERIPSYYGMLGQETNGAGGILKAFRTIPVILEIVEDMKKYCPNAWLINFTNPSGMVTEAIVRYGKWDRVIGLCNIPLIATMEEPELINKKNSELIYQFAGLNHFHWHRVFNNDGINVTSKILKEMMEKDAGLPKNIFSVPFFKEQLDNLNMIPCGYHRYYYRQEEMLAHTLEEFKTNGTRGEQVKETEDQLFELYKDPNLDHKPDQLSKRGGAYYSDAACETIASIHSNKQTQMVVSTINNGAIPDLPPECVVEVSSTIGATGAITQSFGTFNSTEKGWLQLMKNMEITICEAAVKGDYSLALQAFIMNPLIPSGETGKKVLDELLIAHKKYLPQFGHVIEHLETKGITVSDDVSRNLKNDMED
ncbi:6-phospho-beta-glucosidase [Amphibacillus sp. Q70]|uniref:6-phospho-beta-glucosidase n=1 Tax=Amphibacillus sp. Q70 TaxID=3453416 RepID=UPI003F84163D